MSTSPNWEFEKPLRETLGTPPQADFDSWQARHEDAVAYLNPVVTQTYRNRRKWMMRITSAAVVAFLIVSIAPLFVSQQTSFAQAAEAIEKATTITYTNTIYVRFTSKDGKRTWLRAERPMETAYRSPHMYRHTRYDREGNLHSVEIVDASTNKALHLNMKKKVATWLNEPTNQYGRGGPFASVKEILRSKPLELVDQRELDGSKINVFRYRRDTKGIEEHKSTFDIWLDAETKELVRHHDPGFDSFNPLTDPDRDKPTEESFSKGTLMGGMVSDIVLDAKLDPELFSMTPPEGFEVVVQPPKPTVTEAEMIEWLGATARFNGNVFFDTSRGFELGRYNKEIASKEEAERTEIEQELFEINTKHLHNRNSPVMASFANEYTVGGRFRYLGKGVELGDADRIVLYYKLKDTGTYRAVYGDLSVKDVDPEALPLPVEEPPRN